MKNIPFPIIAFSDTNQYVVVDTRSYLSHPGGVVYVPGFSGASFSLVLELRNKD